MIRPFVSRPTVVSTERNGSHRGGRYAPGTVLLPSPQPRLEHNSSPVENLTIMSCPPRAPSLRGWKPTLTLSPIRGWSFDHPSETNCDGGPPSSCHVVVLSLSVTTVMWSQACGLTKSNCFTVPDR